MSETVVAIVATGGTVLAAIDLRTRRVPNLGTLALAAVGLGLSMTGASGHSALAAIAGLGLGILLMMPGYIYGGTGAGDVKLFAAMGTLLGPGAVVSAFLYTAIAGGLLAVVVAARRRRLVETVNGVAVLVTTAGANVVDIEAPRRDNRFAYAPAIAVGTLLAALGV